MHGKRPVRAQYAAALDIVSEWDASTAVPGAPAMAVAPDDDDDDDDDEPEPEPESESSGRDEGQRVIVTVCFAPPLIEPVVSEPGGGGELGIRFGPLPAAMVRPCELICYDSTACACAVVLARAMRACMRACVCVREFERATY